MVCAGACAFLLGGLSAEARPFNLISIKSPAFGEGQPIPEKYSLKGGNVSPELRIDDVPANARSLILVCDDPDAPSGVWSHWLVWNLPPDIKIIAEGKLPSGARVGKNSFGRVRYDGPAPPSGTHRYFFRVYALDVSPDLPVGSNCKAFNDIITSGHLVGCGEMSGTFAASP